MTVLFRGSDASPPPETTRDKRQMQRLIGKAPPGPHTKAWWLAWIAANWEV